MKSPEFRIAIAGAATLRGKEVADAIAESVFATSDITLLDDDTAIGQLEAVGDEVAVITALNDDAFDRQDFVFFAGSAEQTLQYWQVARDAGALVVDLSLSLNSEDAVTMFPWQRKPAEVRLETQALTLAHPAAQILALLAERAASIGPVEFLSATILEPASQQDRAGMDELHQQTVKLLSFQPLPKEVNDAQVAFNVLTASATGARSKLSATESLILRQYAVVGDLPAPLLLQIAQTPVFHGYMIALHLRMSASHSMEEIQAALGGPHVELAAEEWPSNLAVSGHGEVLIKVRGGNEDLPGGRDFRLWIAADNLRLAAQTAVEAAASVRHLRPRGEVQ